MKKINYNESTIQTLEPLEAIRVKLPMYAGSNSNEAVHHIVKELISNSIDEYLAGFGDKIVITLDEDSNSITVEDFGRGIPPGKIDDVFLKNHTSGKFIKEGGAYGSSGGLNGIGAKIAVATGKVEVSVIRDGFEYKNWYSYNKMGELTKKKVSKTKSQTIVTWTPDLEPFTDNEIHYNKIKELLQDMSYITPNLTFVLRNGEEIIIKSKGIEEFLKDYIGEKDMLSPIIKFKQGDEKLSIEGAMVWTKKSNLEQSYVNLIPTCDGGTHVTALKTVLTREINKMLGSDLKGDEIRKGWSFILSVKTLEEPAFKGQSKDSLNMPQINAPLSKLYKENIEIAIEQHKKFFEELQFAIEAARKKEAAVSQIRGVLNKANSQKNPLPNKLKPALNKQGAELFICEGDSAAGSLISHRNIYNHAIMALKGKPINVKKHDIEKVLKNQEIQDLIIALGGYGESYNSKKCPYDKIVIMTDADVDGQHINLLLITFFYEFYPQLIQEGKIYTVLTPLYSIKTKKETIYAFSEKEMNEMRTKFPKDTQIARYKGLGEANPEVLAQFAFSEKRELIQYKIQDEETVANLLESFMGIDASDRREYVE